MEKDNIGDEFGLRPLWTILLEIYHECERICLEHGLRFYAAYGTALGAVRHKGFIPWDDDFDLEMPRGDYDKFLEFAGNELCEGFELQKGGTAGNRYLMFSKVALKNDSRVRLLERAMGCHFTQGVFIDIFPVDGLPASSFRRLWRLIRRGVLKAKESVLFPAGGDIRSFRHRFAGFFAWPLKCVYPSAKDKESFFKAQEAILREDDFSTSPYVHELGWFLNELRAYKSRMPYSASIYGTPQWLPFEDTKVPVHEHVEEHLRYEFGDYMKLPPPGKRVPSHLCKR